METLPEEQGKGHRAAPGAIAQGLGGSRKRPTFSESRIFLRPALNCLSWLRGQEYKLGKK